MPTQEPVAGLIHALEGDRTVWATAPCGHEYRLADSILFHGNEIPIQAREAVRARKEQLTELRTELTKLNAKLTTRFVTRSVDIKLGKTMEKIVPGLRGFPYAASDCRPLFEPIDYIAFRGLSTGSLEGIDFIDVKTGQARLSRVQKTIREVVEEGAVTIEQL